ncbi:MAG: tyrosine-type recombinase/integrase [Dysgonomonas sp.]
MLVQKKYYRNAIVAYYKKNDSVIRYTLFKTDKKNVGRYIRLKDNPGEYDADIENMRIDKLLRDINDVIVELITHNPDIKLSNSLISARLGRIKGNKESITDDLEKFIEIKLAEKLKDNPEIGNTFPSGLKDYRSLKNALLDYQNDQEKIFSIADIRVKTQKTGKTVEIPLVPRAIEIATKYNYTFNKYVNQIFNRKIKEFLGKHKLLEDEIKVSRVIRKKSNDYICKRREKISAHTGRRTFISILVESGMPLQMIMSMTGHTQIKTLQIYIDKFSPEKRKYMEILNI